MRLPRRFAPRNDVSTAATRAADSPASAVRTAPRRGSSCFPAVPAGSAPHVMPSALEKYLTFTRLRNGASGCGRCSFWTFPTVRWSFPIPNLFFKVEHGSFSCRRRMVGLAAGTSDDPIGLAVFCDNRGRHAGQGPLSWRGQLGPVETSRFTLLLKSGGELFRTTPLPAGTR